MSNRRNVKSIDSCTWKPDPPKILTCFTVEVLCKLILHRDSVFVNSTYCVQGYLAPVLFLPLLSADEFKTAPISMSH